MSRPKGLRSGGTGPEPDGKGAWQRIERGIDAGVGWRRGKKQGVRVRGEDLEKS